MADLKETLKRNQEGGVVIGKKKLWSLAYADDIALIAKTERKMKDMMRCFEREAYSREYLRRKGLELNVEKSKMMECRRGGGREARKRWEWRGMEIEQVKTFKYLGYNFMRNGGNKEHMKELTWKANVACREIWGVGERIFKENFKTRMWMFGHLIKSVATYGAEIWGWREREEIERVQIKYIKWVLGLKKNTPNYIVLEETNRDKMRMELGRRALRFEEKLRVSERELVKECFTGRMKENYKGRNKEEREKYLRRNGVSTEGVERIREEEEDYIERIKERDIEVQRQGQMERIRRTRYCERYKRIWTEKLPEYLERHGRGDSQRIIAKARCGNMDEGEREWTEESERKCGVCGEGWATLEHWTGECKGVEEKLTIEEVLEEEGRERAVIWLRRIELMREK